jgi:hypothetical protein
MFAFVFAIGAQSTCPSPASSPVPTKVAHQTPVDELYAQRARRRIQSYLRLRLYELREQQLDRVADVIAHRISIDDFLAQTSSTHPLAAKPDRSCRPQAPPA